MIVLRQYTSRVLSEAINIIYQVTEKL